MKTLWIKEWFYEKTQETAARYNIFIDYAERNEGEIRTAKMIDGYVSVIVEEEIGESEKAIQVRLRSGDVVGSMKGWKTWIPRSVIMA